MSKKNAIEKQIDTLGELWNEFAAEPDLRLLRWRVDRDGERLLRLFVDVQNEGSGDIPDLFLKLEIPFADPARHGAALVEALQERYEADRKFLAEEGLPAEWQCPVQQPDEGDLAYLVNCCASFQTYYQALFQHLVLVLLPEQVGDWDYWQAWLLAAARRAEHPNLRLMVLDDVDTPRLEALCAADPALTATITPELDMTGAMADLARGAGGTGPGFDFRRMLLGLNTAAGSGDLNAVQQYATAALKIARAQQWPQMQVVVYITLGAALLGAERGKEAIAAYRKAAQVSAAAANAGDPAGHKLLLQSRLAEASVLVGEPQYREAAAIYEELVPLAQQEKDALLTLECWRMAAYCHEQDKAWKAAWRCGQEALAHGAQIEADQRRATTLPYAGQGLLRLTERDEYRPAETEVRRQMTELLGDDWESLLQQKEAV